MVASLRHAIRYCLHKLNRFVHTCKFRRIALVYLVSMAIKHNATVISTPGVLAVAAAPVNSTGPPVVVLVGVYIARVSMLVLVAAWIWPSLICETTAPDALTVALAEVVAEAAGAWTWPSVICVTAAWLFDDAALVLREDEVVAGAILTFVPEAEAAAGAALVFVAVEE